MKESPSQRLRTGSDRRRLRINIQLLLFEYSARTHQVCPFFLKKNISTFELRTSFYFLFLLLLFLFFLFLVLFAPICQGSEWISTRTTFRINQWFQMIICTAQFTLVPSAPPLSISSSSLAPPPLTILSISLIELISESRSNFSFFLFVLYF